jgi:hypothetical protein
MFRRLQHQAPGRFGRRVLEGGCAKVVLTDVMVEDDP